MWLRGLSLSTYPIPPNRALHGEAQEKAGASAQ